MLRYLTANGRRGHSLQANLNEEGNRFGESAAIDFVSIYASEALTRAIETVMDNENRKNPPTLATVRDARWPAASPPAWSETASWKTMRPNC